MSEVETTRDGAVLTITFNRPEVLNALDGAAHAALAVALEQAAAPEVRAVVLTGAGRGFCVGQDLQEFRAGAGDVEERLRTQFNRHALAIRSLEKPVLALVNGAAAGAGLSLALACDLRIASDQASFVPAFVGIGLVPDTGATWFVRRLLGYARAFEWLTSGRKLTAAEALQWGLVSEVVPAAELEQRGHELAALYAAMPTRAVAFTKSLLDSGAATLDVQLDAEVAAQVEAAATADFAEGVKAFLERRKPEFEGR